MRILQGLRRSFTSFLAVPSIVIAIFALIAVGSYSLEQADPAWLRPLRDSMQDHFFGDPQATSNLLGTIAGGVITITSITFSLLLLALQQSAGSLTPQVFDQFLRRRGNQIYFGYFVGMTLYTLVTLATVSQSFNPVFGATLALILSISSLYVLLILIYSTISQMRPSEIIKAIHDHTLHAREKQRVLIGRTYRSAQSQFQNRHPVVSEGDGYIVDINLDAIESALENAAFPAEVVFRFPIGSYVAFHDHVASVLTERTEDTDDLGERIRRAIRIDRERNLDTDPAFGIEQLETIAWRSISTSQQNPSPGIIAINNLRDLLSRWSGPEDQDDFTPSSWIVYPDNVPSRLLGAFESLTVVASESMQHQVFAEIVRSLAITFDRLSLADQHRVEEVMLVSLSALGDHVLTARLDLALTSMVVTLETAGRHATAAAIRKAHGELARTIGVLNSRSSRVATGS